MISVIEEEGIVMKNCKWIFFIVAVVLTFACSSGGEDDGMMPDPNPTPSADFTVRAAAKTSNHPWANQGHSVAYTINGTEALTLTLKRGTTYVFSINTPTHPFYISSDDSGEGAGEITSGVTGSMTENGTLRFTPNSTHPDLLYYQCAVHSKMGYLINIVDP